MTHISYQVFQGSTARQEEVVAFAKTLRGRKLRDLVPAAGRVGERSIGDKGIVGQLVERAFGLPRSNEQRPDFAAAGIELKVVPLKRTTGAVRAKERTSVTMIDYGALVEESWPTASVRRKLEKILFVFYFHVTGADPLDTVVEEILLWTPPSGLLPQLESDWTAVYAKVLAGRAHEISEGDGRVLGAATKGAGGGRLVSQPRNASIGAKPRAWAIKPALTSWLYEQERRSDRPVVTLRDALQLGNTLEFEPAVINRLSAFTGMTLSEVSRAVRIPLSPSKSGAALLVRRAIGVLDDRAFIREFKERGIEIKVVPVSPSGRPYEAMSFPRFDHMEVWKDDWEESDLLQQLNRILIVPLVRRTRKTARGEQYWGSAFFWSPSDEELRGIEVEWRDYVRRIEAGEARTLPAAAETRFIHVRPHARNMHDTERAPMVGEVVKKSFWLNQDYLSRIIAAHGGIPVLLRRS